MVRQYPRHFLRRAGCEKGFFYSFNVRSMEGLGGTFGLHASEIKNYSKGKQVGPNHNWSLEEQIDCERAAEEEVCADPDSWVELQPNREEPTARQ